MTCIMPLQRRDDLYSGHCVSNSSVNTEALQEGAHRHDPNSHFHANWLSLLTAHGDPQPAARLLQMS